MSDRFPQTCNDTKEEKERTSAGLFEVLNEKLKCNIMRQYCHGNISS